MFSYIYIYIYYICTYIGAPKSNVLDFLIVLIGRELLR